jgi:hypothetical protein
MSFEKGIPLPFWTSTFSSKTSHIFSELDAKRRGLTSTKQAKIGS